MAEDLIVDRGCGPQFAGTRITVFHLIPYFLEASESEASIAEAHGLTVEQVAAGRAYVLNHLEVMERHWEIEARNAAGNPPEFLEQVKRVRAKFEQYRQWFREREAAQASGDAAPEGKLPIAFPSFQQWNASQEIRSE
jgi:hypothetical protein